MTGEGKRTWHVRAGQDGQGLVEYALVIVLAAIVVVGVLALTGGGVQNAVQNIVDKLGW